MFGRRLERMGNKERFPYISDQLPDQIGEESETDSLPDFIGEEDHDDLTWLPNEITLDDPEYDIPDFPDEITL